MEVEAADEAARETASDAHATISKPFDRGRGPGVGAIPSRPPGDHMATLDVAGVPKTAVARKKSTAGDRRGGYLAADLRVNSDWVRLGYRPSRYWSISRRTTGITCSANSRMLRVACSWGSVPIWKAMATLPIL